MSTEHEKFIEEAIKHAHLMPEFKRDAIKKEMGWDRLTKKRLHSWIRESLEKSLNLEDYRQLLTSLIYELLFMSSAPLDQEEIEKAITVSGDFPFDDEDAPIDKDNIESELEECIKRIVDANPELWRIDDDQYILVPTSDILRVWYLFNCGVKLSEMHEYPSDILDIQQVIQAEDQIEDLLKNNDPLKRILAATLTKNKFKKQNEAILIDMFNNDQDQMVRYGSFVQLMNDKKLSREKIELMDRGLADLNTKIKLASFDFLHRAARTPLTKDQTNQIIEIVAEYLDDDLLEYNALTLLIDDVDRTEVTPHLFKYLEENYPQLESEIIEAVKEKISSVYSDKSRIPKNVREEIKGYCGSDNISVQDLALRLMGKDWRRSELSDLNRIKVGSPTGEISKLKALGKLGTKKDIEYITKALNNPEKGVRDAAAFALGELGSKKEMDILKKLMVSNDYDTPTIIEAIHKIKNKSGSPLMPTKSKKE
jgi:HEAT repeat protein